MNNHTVYQSIQEASIATTVSDGTISSCLYNKRYNGRIYNNLIFFFEDEYSEYLLSQELNKFHKDIEPNTTTKEQYKDITIDNGSWIGLYKVSNLGNVYSIKSKRILKPTITKSGYTRVNLYQKDKCISCFVHRLVAHEFIQIDEQRKQVNHINAIRHDNRACNLEYVTPQENRNSGNCAFSSVNTRYRKVVSIDVQTFIVKEHNSPAKAFEYTDVFTEDVIINCNLPIESKTSIRGFIFLYEDEFNDNIYCKLQTINWAPAPAFEKHDSFDHRYSIVGISLCDGKLSEFATESEAVELGYEYAVNACNNNYFNSNIYCHHLWFYKIEDERWTSVFGFEEKYQISNYGRIKIISTNKVIKPQIKNTYFHAHLQHEGKSKSIFVHKLVFISFNKSRIKKGYCINHINECRTCNCLWNLEAITFKQNTLHGTCTQRIAMKKKVPVVAYHLRNKTMIKADSLNELAVLLNVSHSAISLCVRNINSTNKNYINGYCIYTESDFSKLTSLPTSASFEELSVNDKITESTKISFVSINVSNKEVTYYESYKIAIENGFSKASLSNACHGRNKKIGHLYKGHLWFFMSDFEKIDKSSDITTFQYLPTEGGRAFNKSVVSISTIDYTITVYNNAKSCSVDKFNEWNVSKACRGKSNHTMSEHLYKDHLWFYKYDFDQMCRNGLSVRQICQKTLGVKDIIDE